MNVVILRRPTGFIAQNAAWAVSSIRLLLTVALAVLFVATPVRAQSTRPGMGAIPYADTLGTGVTFRVWAPNATSVAVRGSFNAWNATANLLVKESGSSGLWSGDIAAARNGDEYKYYLNGSLWKRDPRGRKVVNSSGNSIVYDPNAFNWGGDTRLAVNKSDLVIYEMHAGAFYDPTPGAGGPGKFADAITKLDYLATLGVNAVQLMPVSEFAGDLSWGYNPADVYAVENTAYGGPDGLKNFVKAAHQRGLRVLLDVVHNHYGPSDLDLWTFDNGASPSIYFYSAPDICCTQWGGRPNYSSEGVRSFIIGNFRLWMDEYHIDGFRWDSVGSMRKYAPNYYSIPEADSLIQYINSTIIHSDHPGAISIAEDESGGMDFDGEWARSFGDAVINEMVKGTDSDRNMNTLQNAMDGSGHFRVLYTESHDLVGNLNGAGAQRLPKRIHAADPTSFFARKRSMLAAAIAMTSPGIPMLFMGQEMLAIQQFADNSALDWSRVTNYAPVVNFYRDLTRLRRNLDGVSPGLTGPNISWHVVDNTAKLLAFHRWGAGANDQVMVVLNCSNTSITNRPIGGFPANGTWFANLNSDWTAYGADFGNRGSSHVQVAGGSGNVSIGPYSVLILSRAALPALDSDGDGLLNGWEQQHFGDALSGVATTDNDGDGASNLQEQAADTNPNSANSVLKFTTVQAGNGTITLNWQGGQAARQVIQQAPGPNGPWTSLYTNPPPSSVTNSLNVPATTSTARCFRIQIEQ
jgi:1,4-alpha-glucan branching enzyme